MQTILKRVTATLLAVVLVIGMLSMSVFAATDSGECGDDMTWLLDAEGTLTITGSGEMWELETHEDPETGMLIRTLPWNAQAVRRVVVENGVETIAFGAFFNCVNLISVSMPSSVWEIGSSAFSGCSSLTDVTLPAGLQELGWSTFAYCTSLQKIVLPAGMCFVYPFCFEECTALNSVVLPKSIQSFGFNAFTGCTGLETVYYMGTDAQWNQVEINWGNDALLNANIVCNYDPAPAAPVVVGTHDAATGKNMLVWEPVEGAVAYKVYRAASKDGPYTLMKTVRDGNSYVNSTAEHGVTYYYKVKAVDADGLTSKYSAVKTLTCDLAQPVVKATNVASSGYNKLTWEPIEGATAYKVYRSTSRNGSYTLMKTVRDGATSYVNSNAVAGTTYYYYVVAVMDGCAAADSAKSEIKISTCDLARPTVTLTAGTGKITVKWDVVDKATGYKVYRATSSTGEYKLIKTVTSGDTTSFTNTGLTAGKKYYYKMVAILDGKEAATSAYSAVKYTTVK